MPNGRRPSSPRRAAPASSVVCPASGSRLSLTNVGVLAAPCIVTLPSPTMPLPTCAGSIAGSIGWSAMTISAVTSGATGVAALPISRKPAFGDHDRAHFHSGVRGGRETQVAADLDAGERGVADGVVHHLVTGRDRDLVVRSRHPAGRPGARVRPGAAAHARDRRVGTEVWNTLRHAADLACAGECLVQARVQRRQAQERTHPPDTDDIPSS